MNVLDVYRSVAERLKSSGIEASETESALLLMHVLHKTRTELFLANRSIVAPGELDEIDKLLARRLQFEPLAYILGEKEFWSLPFKVTPDVLIPRPETEELLEKILQTIKNDHAPFKGPILELGVGSGVISIILALELPQSVVYGIDKSLAALKVAAYNAKLHNVAARIGFMCADWLNAIVAEKTYQLVVANPPYIASTALSGLQKELEFEPLAALDGGASGLVEMQCFLPEISRILLPGGWLFMEIGFDQKEFLLDYFSKLPEFHDVEVHMDYAGLPRIFQARLQENK